MQVLTQFVLRLSFGLAVGMAVTSPRQVTSGYFRNHAYVLLGLNVLATLAAIASKGQLSIWPPFVGAIVSYLCSAVWLYEKPRWGIGLLFVVAVVSLIGAWLARPVAMDSTTEAIGTANSARVLWLLDPLTGGLVLGSTIAAMFLGHWYLNTPTMELAPLRKLILLMAIGIASRALVCGIGLALEWQATGLNTSQLLLVGLRWTSGIAGAAALASMAWQTLKIPNTQSATGILYVAVIATFLGELTSQLLSAGTTFPL
jgi:hypothetical protein